MEVLPCRQAAGGAAAAAQAAGVLIAAFGSVACAGCGTSGPCAFLGTNLSDLAGAPQLC